MKRLFLALTLAIPMLAIGPKIPYTLTFTPSPSAGVTGYFFYYRATNQISYLDIQRWSIPTNANTGYDIRVLGLQKGQYWVMMTATNATSESDPSVEFFWDYTNPNKPSNLNVQ